MRNSLWIFPLLFFFGSCHPAENKPTPDFLAENIDTTISPASDFFLYANGTWIKNNPIPADQSGWSVGSLINLDIYNRLRTINEKATSVNAAPGSITRKIGDFWFSGMDSAGIEKEGLDPLKPELSKIQSIKNLQDLLNTAAELEKMGVPVMMGVGVYQDEKSSNRMMLHFIQGGLGMSDRDYYFNTDEKSDRVRKAYQFYLYRSFRTLGKDSFSAMLAAKQVFQLESGLAKMSRTIAALRDPRQNYHIMDLPAIEKLCRQIKWKNFLLSSGFPVVDSVIVGQPEFFSALSQELTNISLETWKNYLSFHLLNSSALYMNQSVFQDQFDYTRTLTGAEVPKPRWKRVIDAEQNAIGEALGHLFVNEYFPQKSKQRYEDLVESIREAYKERIIHLSWMSDSTKQKALLKLSRIVKKVGYPDKWRDFSSMVIDRGPFVLNVQRANAWWYTEQVKKLNKPVDRTEWDMTPQTYNAYYNSGNNEIVLPAAIFLVPGKKDEDLDDAFVYGYTGASTIGHEMTHGFDDQGRQFDEQGNLHNWWQPEDERLYKENAKRIVRQFNEFIPVDTLHVNGEATQGENIADLGGLLIAWDAFIKTDSYKKGKQIGGFTPAQRFFLGYSYGWLSQRRKEAMASQLMTDVHALPKERVNGPMANIPAFYEAFGVKPGDKMYRPDSLRVNIW